MQRSFERYRDAYRHIAMTREEGVLELRLHTDGGPLVWGAGPHSELGWAFREIGGDPANRVVVLTGTGTEFIARLDDSWVGAMTPPKWERIYTDGKRLLTALLDIEVPVIGAINGRATVHAELALLSDIVLAASTTVFSDAPHFRFGTVPGDGVHAIWSTLLGVNRARYFLLTGQRIGADEARDLGVVNEVVADEDLLPRARTLARELCGQDDITLRYTREVMIEPLRRLVAGRIGHGLALEGLGAFATWPT